MEPTFEERRSERLRRYEERRAAEERREAIIDGIILMLPLAAMWAFCWAYSFAVHMLP